MQEATIAMLALADELSGSRPAALVIAQHAWKAGISLLPLLRAAHAVGLVFGPDEFRALLEESSLPEEQVLSVAHLKLPMIMYSSAMHSLRSLDWRTVKDSRFQERLISIGDPAWLILS